MQSTVQNVVKGIADIYKAYGHNSASGYLSEPFKLEVTRPGCQFKGTIASPTKFIRWNNSQDLTK